MVIRQKLLNHPTNSNQPRVCHRSDVAPINSAIGAKQNPSFSHENFSLASITLSCDGDRTDMATVTVSPKYQIVIPKDVRERLVMAPGDKIEVIQLEGRIELIPVRSAKSLKGFLKGRKNTFQRENDRCLP